MREGNSFPLVFVCFQVVSKVLCKCSGKYIDIYFILKITFHCFYYHIIYFIICQFAALFPLVTSQAWLRSDVLEPQPGVNCWREPYVPGSGCSGQVSSGSFRFPP